MIWLYYFISFILKMVNTPSDKIQVLIERKSENKFKELQLSLIDEVKKILLELFRLKLKRLFKRKLVKAARAPSLYQFFSSM